VNFQPDLPGGPWEILFSRAMPLIEDLTTVGGITDPFWTFGGATVLMFRYDHRAGKDIDIFVAVRQWLRGWDRIPLLAAHTALGELESR
jgi:hypothetical protein